MADQQLSKWPGHLAVLAVNIFFGFNSPMAKYIVPQWISPGAFTLVRMTVATIVFWIVASFFPQQKVSLKDKGIIFIGGMFGLVLVQYSFAQALRYTSPVHITLISALSPIVVMLLAAVFLKEPISWQKTLGVLLGVAGIVLLIFGGKGLGDATFSLAGDILCMANITSYAIYLIITRKVTQKYTALTLMKWMFLFSAFCTIPLGINEVFTAPIWHGPIEHLLRLIYIVIFATIIAYFLIPLGLKRIRPTTVSMYNNLQPIIASVVAIYLGQDYFSWEKVGAALLVFWGVWLVTNSRSKASKMQKTAV